MNENWIHQHGKKVRQFGVRFRNPLQNFSDFICGAKIPISQQHMDFLPGRQAGLGPQGSLPVPGRSRDPSSLDLVALSILVRGCVPNCFRKANPCWLVVEFQPILKNMRKSNWESSSPSFGVNIQKCLSCHHPA